MGFFNNEYYHVPRGTPLPPPPAIYGSSLSSNPSSSNSSSLSSSSSTSTSVHLSQDQKFNWNRLYRAPVERAIQIGDFEFLKKLLEEMLQDPQIRNLGIENPIYFLLNTNRRFDIDLPPQAP